MARDEWGISELADPELANKLLSSILCDEAKDTMIRTALSRILIATSRSLVTNPLVDKIQKWKDLTDKQEKADDNTRCPVCGDQMIACHCPQNMAQEILKEMRGWNPETTKRG
jgi:hypothetical protein